MSVTEFLLGRPLASEEGEGERVGPLAGVPILGLDALASAAYGPEALLTVLLPLGVGGLHLVMVLTLFIVAVLLMVFISYQQTIPTYPNGGGAYTVCKENLGTFASLLAAAALALDYLLNVAVAISAGVGALVSAVPPLLPYTLPLCLFVLTVLILVNLRGVRSSGAAFMSPTYLFVGSLFLVIGVGVIRTAFHGGHPVPVVAHRPVPALVPAAGLWMVLRAFASGCTAMTGVEAVSNGVPIFRRPPTRGARQTLTTIIGILITLLVGEAILCRAYGITATVPGQSGYRSVLSQLTDATIGHGPLYYIVIASIVTVLALSANTSFADFPRLCRLLALDRFLPEPFVHRGRRLAFSHGILVLGALSALLLIVFRGITDALIPLFAIGAFLAFTMSQAGMVMHWHKRKGGHAKRSLVLNASGAVATAATLLVVLASKFTEGAWISVLLVALMLLLFHRIHRYFELLHRATDTTCPLEVRSFLPPIAVVPLRRWDRIAQNALQFALEVAPEVYAVQVLSGDRQVDDLTPRWKELVEAPAQSGGLRPPRLVVLASEYRRLFRPLLDFVRTLACQHPDRQIAVVVPELVERRWYHYLLHGNTSSMLKAMLLFRGGRRIVIINTPFRVGD